MVPITSLQTTFLTRVTLSRYFADNVRDDYAAGQLDAQVRLSSV